MRFRIPPKLALVLALIICSAAFLGAKTTRNEHDTVVPVVFEVNPPNPGPNTQVTIEVQLAAVASNSQVVTIGCTDPTAFVDLPSGVVVPAGTDTYSFQAATSATFSGYVVLAATANGGTALAVAVH